MTQQSIHKFLAQKATIDNPIEPYIPDPVELVPWGRTMRVQKMSKWLYGYIRVSTMDQFKSGLSIEHQLKQVTHYIENIRALRPQWAEHQFAGVYVEGPQSASKKAISERPVGKVLCERLRPGDGIIFLKYSRAFRNMRHLLNQKHEWDKKKIQMLFMDLDLDLSTPQGAMMLGFYAMIAEVEARNTSENTKNSMQAKKARGDKLGRYPNAGLVIVRSYDAEYDRRSSREFIRHDLVAIIRLIAWYKDTMKMTYRQISDRVEALLAKHENRDPVPYVSFKRERRWSESRCRSGYIAWHKLIDDGRRLEWWNHSRQPEEVGMIRGEPYATVNKDRRIPEPKKKTK